MLQLKSGWLAADISKAARTTDEWRANHLEEAAKRADSEAERWHRQAAEYRASAQKIRDRQSELEKS